MLISDFGSKAYKYIPDYLEDNRFEVIDFLIDFASENPTNEMKDYIFAKIDNYYLQRENLNTIIKLYCDDPDSMYIVKNHQNASVSYYFDDWIQLLGKN